MIPYIGITGFISKEEMETFNRLFISERKEGQSIKDLIKLINHKIMIGVLVSHKTLLKELPDNQKRYPHIDDVRKIFIEDDVYFNCIHFNSKDFENLFIHLSMLTQIPHINGIQLNISWPPVKILRQFKSKFPEIKIILQIGERAYREVGESPRSLYSKLTEYSDSLDFILFDMSGGNGILIDTNDTLIKMVADLYQKMPNIGIGVAGGLSYDSISALVRMFETLKSLNHDPNRISIDAEGRLRDENDLIIIGSVLKYILASYALFEKI